MSRMDAIEKDWLKKKTPSFNVGDSVDVHMKIVEGEKERIQVFSGTVIGRRGHGLGESFTVRRIVAGEGLERIFPVHSPRVVDVKVTRRGKVRRAKLYYLRGRVGRATKVNELVVGGEAGASAKAAAAPKAEDSKAAPAGAAAAAPSPEPKK